MILNLQNNLFKTNPYEVYKEKNIEPKQWNKIWYKRKFLDYQINELCEFINTVWHIEITPKQLSRFLARYEMFIMIEPFIKKKESTIHIDYFPDNIKTFIKDYYNE